MQKSTEIRRVIPGVVVTAAALASASPAIAAQLAPRQTTKTAKAVKYRGPFEDMRWGPVRVTITVKNKKIVNVSADVSPETDRSQFIDDQAVPLLKQEVLQAQSANIDEISGATDTSQAYIQSLQAAVKSARHHKALK